MSLIGDVSSVEVVGPAVPIGDYALLGDTRTAALVSIDGAIDWLCVPRFDGEPVFGQLVGGREAGTFRVGPAEPTAVIERTYRRHSATVETTWKVGQRRLTLTDGMVSEVAGRLLPATLLVRRLTAYGSPINAMVEFDPRLGSVTSGRESGGDSAWGSCASGDRLRCRWPAIQQWLSNPGRAP